jgi:hypothetical protein
MHPPSPPYAVDPAVASAWSGRSETDIAQSWSVDDSIDGGDRNNQHMPPPPHGSCRPDLVKRATSNQNETVDTKPGLMGPSVKRAALNRDSSAAANRLKELCGFSKPVMNRPFNIDREMRQLSYTMEKSSLDTSYNYARPAPISGEQRTTTQDAIDMDLMAKPVSLGDADRSSTLEALNIDFEDNTDAVIRPGLAERSRTIDRTFDDREEDDAVPKPNVITARNRLSTNECYEIFNEPIDEDDLEGDDEEDLKQSDVSRDTSLGEWVAGI